MLNVYVELEAHGRGTAIVRELVGIAGREGVGRLWLHATSRGRWIYEAAGFEGRSIEEMQLVLSGRELPGGRTARAAPLRYQPCG